MSRTFPHGALSGTLLAALSGVSLATAGTGAVHSLVAAPPCVIIAFGAACLALACARSGCTKRLALSWCAGACIGVALPAAQPVGVVHSRAPLGSRGSDLFALLDELDAHSDAVLGRRVHVEGTWTPQNGATPASVSHRVMACCAADAIDVGLDVETRREPATAAGSSVCVEGTMAARMRGGELRYEIVRAVVRASRCNAR